MRVPTVINLSRVLRPAVPLALCLSLATPAFATTGAVVEPAGTVRLGADESVPARTTILGASDVWVIYGSGSSYSATSLRDGHTVALGGHGDVPHLAGSMVVIPHVDILEWVDLDTGDSGTAAYPPTTFATATPTGWLLGAGTTHADFVDARTGTVAPIALPANWTLQVAQVGPLGALLIGHGGAANASQYVAFTTPGTLKPLALSSYCRILTTVDVACSVGTSVAVVPLDGSPAVTWDTPQGAGVTQTTDRVGWTDFDGRFHTSDKHGNNRLDSAQPIDVEWATSREFLYVGGNSAAEAGIYRLTDVGSTPALVVPLGSSTQRAAAIAVGPGRVAWIDNASSSSAVWTQDFGTQAGGVDLGARTTVAAQASAWMDVRAFLATSGRRTVYGSFRDLMLYENGTTKSLVHTSSNWLDSIQLSGSRLLFTRYLTTTVINVRTRAAIFTGRGLQSPRLFGNYLAYALSNGSVWRRDLVTGRVIMLRGPLLHRVPATLVVAIHGDFVAWQVPGEAAYRNARTLTAPVRLPTTETLVGLTGAGVLTYDDVDGDLHLLLRAYGARATTTVFTHPGYYVELTVGGSSVAWLDDTHKYQPRLSVLPPGRDQPQLLGNALAPLTTTRSHLWSAEWDTSAPLTSCALQLLRGRTVVRTVACDPGGMAVGVATAAWDGKSHAGLDVTGRLAWRLVAGNSSGRLLAADGRPLAITGVVTAR